MRVFKYLLFLAAVMPAPALAMGRVIEEVAVHVVLHSTPVNEGEDDWARNQRDADDFAERAVTHLASGKNVDEATDLADREVKQRRCINED